MPFRQRFFRRNREAAQSLPTKPSNEKKKSKKRKICAKISRFLLQGSIPLMIAVFTVISYIQQKEISEANRRQDLDIARENRLQDLRISNETRLKDLEIANLSRQQDLEIANLSRKKDWEIAQNGLDIANETRVQDQDIANLTREHDRKLVEEQREEDRLQQLDLHYQTLYRNYIDDISAIIYKEPQGNQTTFKTAEAKNNYIRRKTLSTLKEIDSERRSQLFIFLLENDLLPDVTQNTTISLQGAHLYNISVKSPITENYTMNGLVLQSVNLVNSTFINCDFENGTDFTGSVMSSVNFTGATFGKLVIRSANLVNSTFVNCNFTNGTDFTGSLMTNVSFINCDFQCEYKFGPTNLFEQVQLDHSHFERTSLCSTRFKASNLISSNFSDVWMKRVSFVTTNLSGSTLNVTQEGISRIDKVILPNGRLFSTVINVSRCARWNQTGVTIAGDKNGDTGDDLHLLNRPRGIFIDLNDDDALYIADEWNERVVKLRQGESNGEVVVSGRGRNVKSLLVDENQNLYVTGFSKVTKFGPDDTAGETVAGEDKQQGLFGPIVTPSGLALDKNKNLYISDSGNNRVVKFKPNTKNGAVIAGAYSGSNLDAWRLHFPEGIYLDENYDALYVADSRNHRIQRFHPIGNETGETVAGNGTKGNSLHQLYHPACVIVVNSTDMYIVDTLNHRVVRWIFGKYSEGGTCIVGCTGKWGDAPNELYSPIYLQFDSKGNLLISDGDCRIQKYELITNMCQF